MTHARIIKASWFERQINMRLPFQFGNTEMRETAEAYCLLELEIDGKQVSGRSAQLMVPRWFDKRDTLSNSETIDELRDCVRTAIDLCVDLGGTALEITRALRAETAAALPENTPDLAAGFGPALVEMAVIDAICRATNLPFWKAARDDLFGLMVGCPEDLSKNDLRASLDKIKPPTSIRVRHTIGFDAPLVQAEIGADAPQDGLPVSVEEVRTATGINAYKIKLKGNVDADLDRLRAISKVLNDVPELAITLDANEQYATEEFAKFVARFKSVEALGVLHNALRFIEQPFAREVALTSVGKVDFGVPLVIDESDDAEDSFARALELGWAGTSIKSCKGILRALLNKARADVAHAILSGEDLTCQPGLCWEQDIAMAAACDVADVERNGHHFAGGMQGAAQTEIDGRMAAHPNMYKKIDGKPTLSIAGGQVDLSSLRDEYIDYSMS